jgi:hypothetical protein
VSHDQSIGFFIDISLKQDSNLNSNAIMLREKALKDTCSVLLVALFQLSTLLAGMAAWCFMAASRK